MSTEQRLDAYLVSHSLASGRDKACELIRGGNITVGGVVITKPAYRVSETDTVCSTAETDNYVGRGGIKLEHALSQVEPLRAGCMAMDVGASTGGFTDCLLQHGAAHVYAVDVGHDQLHPSLRADPRVSDLSGTDIRGDALRESIPTASVDVLTMDVSFISLRAALPSVFPFLTADARLFVLIKPQFEVGRADIGKNGIVRDKKAHARVLRELCDLFVELGCGIDLLTPSPITGGAGRRDGNREYVAVLHRGTVSAVPDVRRIVDEAFLETRCIT